MSKKSDTDVVVELFDLLRKITPWAGIGWISWCVVEIFRAIEGTLTLTHVDVLVSVFSNIGGPVYAWGVAFVALGYGYLQRRERLRKTSYFQGRIMALESKLDPNRTSSQLEADGTSREQDRL